jgi:hypothetical protein
MSTPADSPPGGWGYAKQQNSWQARYDDLAASVAAKADEFERVDQVSSEGITGRERDRPPCSARRRHHRPRRTAGRRMGRGIRHGEPIPRCDGNGLLDADQSVPRPSRRNPMIDIDQLGNCADQNVVHVDKMQEDA